MNEKKHGGITIGGDFSGVVAGDMVGGDKTTHVEVSSLAREFSRIKDEIKKRDQGDNADQERLISLLTKIEAEVGKGESADGKKLERWLESLADTADDICQITLAALSNPVAGLVKVIHTVVKRVQKRTR